MMCCNTKTNTSPAFSGDSGGNVQFWDGHFGTLLAGFSQHQADVLQLAASPDGHTVFAAGKQPGGKQHLPLLHMHPSGAGRVTVPCMRQPSACGHF